MWKRLPAAGINKNQWDACVISDSSGLVYALSWYLDAVAPNWEGWAKEQNNEYVAVLPIVKRRIAGKPVITQPLLTQQFGLFRLKPSIDLTKLWQELLLKIFKPGSAVEQYCLKPSDFKILKNLLPVIQKTNLVLPLHLSYREIKTAYHSNRIRDLHKATLAKLQLQRGNNCWPDVFRLYQETILPRLKPNQQTILLKIIPQLIEAAIKQGLAYTYVVLLPNKQVVAGAIFICYKNRLTYLLPAASKSGKKVGASTYLIDQVCQQFAGSEVVLDFEGSSKPGLARFYQSFGAQPEVYGILENYNFSLILKIFYALKKYKK
ncbi:hypothetical protein HUW51_20030 [Adhaeribacter swui]|uniref:GNAT family N-acetyltransferase n=1 Tax=Adhaeribacter swui TaxID=2086471 RepID=A0A7G7GCL5_9BACT|nr:hypothetical protein [Adhaeribacter swui]QNF34899.1 hypothetical protein HUW51_20030 [Adhaeribacter swui]